MSDFFAKLCADEENAYGSFDIDVVLQLGQPQQLGLARNGELPVGGVAAVELRLGLEAEALEEGQAPRCVDRLDDDLARAPAELRSVRSGHRQACGAERWWWGRTFFTPSP